MYQLIIRPTAEKHFARLPHKLKEKILQRLKKLESNPFGADLDIKKLIGSQKSYRLRVGELRVIYELYSDGKKIFVTDIDFRRTTTYY